VTAELRHLGRTSATVEVDFYDQRGKLAAVALVTMIAPTSVEATLHDTSTVPQVIGSRPADPESAERLAPIGHALHTFRPDLYFVENGANGIGGHPPYVLFAVLPWDDLEHTGPEAACLIADMANGVPIYAQYRDANIAYPNTDLSLRFTTAPATREIAATGTLVSLQHGTATTAVQVRGGDQQLAHGLSASLLIPIPTNS
jgi:acyl-coenzyme A thioesterase PaaI-like protein